MLLTESAIDALSLAVLDKHRQAGQSVTLYLSTDGSGTVPVEALRQVIEQGGRLRIYNPQSSQVLDFSLLE